jgi:hypothetical protein
MQFRYHQLITTMKTSYNIASVIILLTIIAACSSVTTFSDRDKAANFSNYKTFAWLPNPADSFANELFSNEIIETNVKNYVNKEMQDRGYVIDIDSPDLILEYNVDIERKNRVETAPMYQYPYNYNWSYNPNYDRYFGYRFGNPSSPAPYETYTSERIPYNEGTLTIGVIDRRTNKLVWRGWSTGTIIDPTTYRANLERDIHTMFLEYPVPLPAPQISNTSAR